ncbi:MAG: PorT family protein [Bacteroidales bacterium]|nr:PorT family protein [Bacteroidales bacterium]
MKKIALLVTLIGLLTVVQAQEEVQRAQLSARIGLSGTTMLIPNSTITSLTSFGYYSTQKLKLGVTGGLIVDIHLKNKWFLQSGVMYGWQRLHQVQNSVFTDAENYHFSIASENLYKMHRLKIPVMIYYHTSLSDNHFLVGAGLFADVALGGKIVYDASAVVQDPDNNTTNYVASGQFDPFLKDTKYLYYSIAGDNYTDKYRLYRGNILQRFNFGIAAEAGYQVSKFYVGVHADFGLLNMMNKEYGGDNYKERLFSFQVMLGYKIN